MPRNQRPCLSEQNPFDPSAAHEQTLEVSDHDLRHKKICQLIQTLLNILNLCCAEILEQSCHSDDKSSQSK